MPLKKYIKHVGCNKILFRNLFPKFLCIYGWSHQEVPLCTMPLMMNLCQNLGESLYIWRWLFPTRTFHRGIEMDLYHLNMRSVCSISLPICRQTEYKSIGCNIYEVWTCEYLQAVIAAAMTEKSPFVVPLGKRDLADTAKRAMSIACSDHLTVYKAFEG